MVLEIDFESTEPLYLQLKKQIIKGIALENLKPGESLPSVRQMASDIGINMHTVNKTYNILKEEGFVVMDRRKGAFISNNLREYNEETLQSIRRSLDDTVAVSVCKGIEKEQFIRMCREIYEEYNQ